MPSSRLLWKGVTICCFRAHLLGKMCLRYFLCGDCVLLCRVHITMLTMRMDVHAAEKTHLQKGFTGTARKGIMGEKTTPKENGYVFIEEEAVWQQYPAPL